MSMPKLTDEQKEQLKMARRASMRIEETWSLYTMFLSQDKRPHEALERAQEAVAVWVEWMDNNDVEPPEIDRPEFSDQIISAMKQMTEHIQAQPLGAGMLVIDGKNRTAVDAEFLPVSDSVPPRTPEQASSTEGTNQQKE